MPTPEGRLIAALEAAGHSMDAKAAVTLMRAVTPAQAALLATALEAQTALDGPYKRTGPPCRSRTDAQGKPFPNNRMCGSPTIPPTPGTDEEFFYCPVCAATTRM